jgi:hypothetical protein
VTIATDNAKDRPRVRPAGRVTVLVAAATVAALVPAAAAAGQSRPAHLSLRSAAGGALVAGDISTVAGGKGPGPAPATSVAFSPCGVSFAAGSVYAAASATVRQVSQAGTLTTPAGTGSFGPLGDAGLATRASLTGACGTAVDGSGNLIIADAGSGRVRAVAAKTGTFYGQAMTAGDIYTVAGGGTGPLGDGGPATSAVVVPAGVALDAAGNLVIADAGYQRIRVVAAKSGTFYGQAMTAGDIYTVAGGGVNGLGDGGPATFAEIGPDGVALDAAGNLVIADRRNNRIRVVAAKTGTSYGQAMTAGDIYTVAGGGTSGLGDGGPATKAQLSAPVGVAVGTAGNLVIADEGTNRIRVVAVKTGTFYGQAMTAGDIYTAAGDGNAGFSGDGGPATKAELSAPAGIAVDTAGNLLIADLNNDRVRVAAAKTGTSYGRAMTAGDIYTIAGNGTVSYSGDGGPATGAQLNRPGWVAVDAAGNLVIADSNFRVRVVAAKTGTFYGQAMTAGDIYTVAGNGTRDSTSTGFLRSGVRATKAGITPVAVALDRAGNLVVSEPRGIRVVAVKTGTSYGRAMTAGDIYTIAGNGTVGLSGDGGPATAAELFDPAGVVADAAGNLVIADSGNSRLRVLAAKTGTFYGLPMTAGDIYTVAGAGTSGLGDGGPAITAQLNQEAGVALDAAGNVVVADSGDRRIRVVAVKTGTFYGQAMTVGDIYTVAGGGTSNPGDGGAATAAALTAPLGVAVDSRGNLVLTDTGAGVVNPRVRVVAAATGTFYGQAMTAGDIYTVAGGNPAGFSGDGGPATGAELSDPRAVAVTGAGGLVFADTANNRIREVAG